MMGVKGRICCYASLLVVLGFIMLGLSFLEMSDKCSLQRFKNSYVVPFAQVDSVNDSRPQQPIPLMEETSKTTKLNLSTIGDDSIGMLQTMLVFLANVSFQYPRK